MKPDNPDLIVKLETLWHNAVLFALVPPRFPKDNTGSG
jgi:hypothetical protein